MTNKELDKKYQDSWEHWTSACRSMCKGVARTHHRDPDFIKKLEEIMRTHSDELADIFLKMLSSYEANCYLAECCADHLSEEFRSDQLDFQQGEAEAAAAYAAYERGDLNSPFDSPWLKDH